MKIYKKKGNLVIEIPYKQDIMDVFYSRGVIGETDNIIGLIVPDSKCSDPECGFALQIDMSYKGKPNQWSDIIVHCTEDRKEFIKLCNKLDIEIYEYPQCSKCKKAIYGCFTLEDGKDIHLECKKKDD